MTAPVLIEAPSGAEGVRVVFSTRRGGVSGGPYASLNLGTTAGDDFAAVRANRTALARAVGIDPARAVTMRQVHGATVHHVGPRGGDGAFTGDLEGVADADACATTHPRVPLLALGADCPVIAAWRLDGQAVVAIHAGWRGLASGVVQAGIAALGASGAGVAAAVGPHVGPCCYPVDAAMRDHMASLFGSDVVRGRAVDLGLCTRRALAAAGVPDTRCQLVGACTSCDAARFFSYRRDGAETGRQAVLVTMGASA